MFNNSQKKKGIPNSYAPNSPRDASDYVALANFNGLPSNDSRDEKENTFETTSPEEKSVKVDN